MCRPRLRTQALRPQIGSSQGVFSGEWLNLGSELRRALPPQGSEGRPVSTAPDTVVTLVSAVPWIAVSECLWRSPSPGPCCHPEGLWSVYNQPWRPVAEGTPEPWPASVPAAPSYQPPPGFSHTELSLDLLLLPQGRYSGLSFPSEVSSPSPDPDPHPLPSWYLVRPRGGGRTL